MFFFFSINKPATFYTVHRVMILDDKKNPFYWHENNEQQINFNLPPGGYFTETPIKKLQTFHPYGVEKYPKFTGTSFLRHLRVFPQPNPNKASISLKKRLILADPKFYYHKYKPLKVFTLCHECFHYFFHSKNIKEKRNRFIHQHIEKQCDESAKNFMLAKGYNPSQISLAVKMLLQGEDRRENIRVLTTDKKNKFRR